MNTNAAVYTTSTGDAPAVTLDAYDEWCYVCSRPTDHRAEHDDLVEEGKARYDEIDGFVYYNPRGLLTV